MPQNDRPSLSNMFNGAIAGSLLGYLMGLHYRSIHGATDKVLMGPSLDWSWLAPPRRKTALSIHYQEILTGLFNLGRGESLWNNSWCNQDKTPQSVHDSCSSPIVRHKDNHEIAPVMDMLEVLNHLLRTTSVSAQGAPLPRTLTPLVEGGIADQNPLQAVFNLLPLLLLGYDNIANQRGWIEAWLQYWQCPSEWEKDAMGVGLTLAQAMKSGEIKPSAYSISLIDLFDTGVQTLARAPGTEAGRQSAELHANNLYPGLYRCCEVFLRSSNNYETGLLALLHLFNRTERDLTNLPLMAGLNGSLLGGKVGFSRLPLIWRQAMTTYKQSLSSNSDLLPRHDAGTGLAALWSGQLKPLERQHPTTLIPRSIP